MNDTIYRQAAIDTINHELRCGAVIDQCGLETAYDLIEELPSAQLETCEGCKHLGKWENEVEYGYPSPCTRCKRRVEDYYER